MSFLTRKYPFEQSKHWLKECLLYCVIVFLILYLLQPFGFSHYGGSKLLVSLLFGAVTFGCCAFYGHFLKQRVQHKVKPWLIWHQALAIIGKVLLIGICNFLLFSLVFHYSLNLIVFLQVLYWTFIIGFFITMVSMGINYNHYLRSRMEELLDNTTEEQQNITVTIHDSSVRGNDLTLPINNLLYMEAQKNNVVVYYTDQGKTVAKELHATLTSVLADLQDYENIFQCHRSFVVNLNNITSAKGNSNGYQLMLGKCTTVVPVSRTYVPRLKSFIA